MMHAPPNTHPIVLEFDRQVLPQRAHCVADYLAVQQIDRVGAFAQPVHRAIAQQAGRQAAVSGSDQDDQRQAGIYGEIGNP